MDKIRAVDPGENCTGKESSPIQRDAVQRLSTVLKAIRDREVAAAQAAGKPMNKGSWASRLADEIDAPDGTVSNWIHGEAFPEWPRLEKLVARFGAELRNAVLPVEEAEFTPERAIRVISEFIAEHKDGGGG